VIKNSKYIQKNKKINLGQQTLRFQDTEYCIKTHLKKRNGIEQGTDRKYP